MDKNMTDSRTWLSVWLEADLSDFTLTQIQTFFNTVDGSPTYLALPRARQLILRAYYQASPNRIYRSKLNTKKWLVYVHFPVSLADELRALPTTITDHIRFVAIKLENIPEAIQTEYFGEVIDFSNASKNYPYLNKFYGVNL
ncbi:MAG TPA: hypothetical protein ACFYEK_10920 [Candidatus Wunengus sp. YC60]|uniref:hypothetical protein n=1 Tax=Candidatus Wunengus sp. YC60 TaxID=3367697 RepID=UPI0040282B1B